MFNVAPVPAEIRYAGKKPKATEFQRGDRVRLNYGSRSSGTIAGNSVRIGWHPVRWDDARFGESEIEAHRLEHVVEAVVEPPKPEPPVVLPKGVGSKQEQRAKVRAAVWGRG